MGKSGKNKDSHPSSSKKPTAMIRETRHGKDHTLEAV